MSTLKLTHFEHDLFLLMLNLTQIKDEEKILSIFTEAINSVSDDLSFHFSKTIEDNHSETFPIKTVHHSFGQFTLEGDSSKLPDTFIALIRNSITMLAVLLENRLQSRLLSSDKKHLELLVEEQTEALRQSEEKFRSVFEQAADSILLIDYETSQIVEFNETTHKHLGYTREEFKELKLSDLDAHQTEQSTPTTTEAVFDKTNEPTELLLQTKTGKLKDVLVSSKHIELQGNKYVSSIWTDITERKKNELEIKAQKLFIQRAIDAQIDTFFLFNPLKAKALLWNRSFEKISGYTSEEISALKTPASYYSDLDLAKASKYIENIIKGETGTIVLDLLCKDGRSIPTEYSASVLKDCDGIPQTIISIGRDVSQRRKAEKEKETLEKQLRHAHKMEAIGTMAGGIAHDFNNILAVILGYSELAKDDIPDWSPAHQQLDEVIKASNRARDLVSQILAFTKKTDQNKVPVHIHHLIEESLTFLRATIPTTITIQHDLDPLSGTILANPTEINQILINLCTNSAQSMENDGGILHVGLKSCNLTDNDLKNAPHLQPGQYVSLSVTDSGMGIEQENIPRIFDPYFTTKEVGKGTGMGLAVVHGIVKSHDGMIDVESTLGEQTQITTFLPLLHDDVVEKVSDLSSLPMGKEKILVVDDDAHIANLTQRRLSKIGYQVTAKTDSVDALEFFRNAPHSYDLVISDQTMPNMTGEKLAKNMREIRPDIPIIICTGYSSQIDAEKARRIGINDYMMKPVDFTTLATTVRNILDE